MKTILVATDFSFCAFNAAKYAVDMAKTIGADLVLTHIDPVPVSYTDFRLMSIWKKYKKALKQVSMR